jgi:hypothetical protein
VNSIGGGGPDAGLDFAAMQAPMMMVMLLH